MRSRFLGFSDVGDDIAECNNLFIFNDDRVEGLEMEDSKDMTKLVDLSHNLVELIHFVIYQFYQILFFIVLLFVCYQLLLLYLPLQFFY